jgi:glucose/arabinose dehydrogenase
VVNERGDNTPFESAAAVRDGGFYGWPWYYIGANKNPRHKGAPPDLKSKVTVPDVLLQAHTAPLQIVFYDATTFLSPPVPQHGSRPRRTFGWWQHPFRPVTLSS